MSTFSLTADSTRRAVRTVLDLFPAFLGTLVILVGIFGFTAAQVAQVSAVVGALTVFLAKVRNGLEDAGYIPAVLKAPASDGADPVPDDAGYTRPGYALGIAVVLAGILLALTVSVPLGVVVTVGGILALCANVSYLD